jgi:hypothetical protein
MFPQTPHIARTLRPNNRALRVGAWLIASALLLSATACSKAPASSGVGQPTSNSASTKTGSSGAPSDMGQVDQQNAATSLDSTATGKGPIVLFDLAHSEIFGPSNTTDVGQSAAVARMRKTGIRVVATHTPYTSQMLKDVAGVVVSGNMRPLADSEITALQKYVTDGGVLLLTVHVAPMDQSLAARFGFGFSPNVLYSQEVSGGDPKNFNCPTIEKDPVTKNVSVVKVMGVWALAARPPARIVVGSNENTWLDVNNDQQLTPDDIKGRFGVVGVHNVGKGTFVVSGDDAVFANIALASKDNMQLFDNIVELMKSSR